MSRKETKSLDERARAKDWRSLPQDVGLGDTKPTKNRRWRIIFNTCAFTALFGVILALFVFVFADLLRELEDGNPATPTEFEFVNEGGVLTDAWFREITGIADGKIPNLNEIRLSVIAYPQVAAARVQRLSNGKIRAEIRERRPVARIADSRGNARLVASDGVIFPAETFPPTQAMLPFVSDAKISVVPEGETVGFECVEGIAPLTDFLDLARVNYRKLYAEWDTISLKSLPTNPDDIAMPWAVFRVTPRATSRNPAHAQISQIVFSASRFREDLKLLAAAEASGTLDDVLSGARAGASFTIRFITNKKNPGDEFREMRVIPDKPAIP